MAVVFREAMKEAEAKDERTSVYAEAKDERTSVYAEAKDERTSVSNHDKKIECVLGVCLA